MNDKKQQIRKLKFRIKALEDERYKLFDLPISELEKEIRKLEWEIRTPEQILKDNNYT